MMKIPDKCEHPVHVYVGRLNPNCKCGKGKPRKFAK